MALDPPNQTGRPVSARPEHRQCGRPRQEEKLSKNRMPGAFPTASTPTRKSRKSPPRPQFPKKWPQSLFQPHCFGHVISATLSSPGCKTQPRHQPGARSRWPPGWRRNSRLNQVANKKTPQNTAAEIQAGNSGRSRWFHPETASAKIFHRDTRTADRKSNPTF